MNKETQIKTLRDVGEYLTPDINVYETEVGQLICTSDTGNPTGPEIPMYD